MNNNDFVDVEKSHWDENWSGPVSYKPLSKLNVANHDVDGIFREQLAGYLNPKVIEIGSAPGKMLLHMEKAFKAECVGIDYSEVGCRAAEAFLKANNASAKMVCADAMADPLPDLAADFVYSIGVVEHFSDPTDMVNAHLRLVRPGGKAVIVLPNYSGLNARIQGSLDPENLAIHNLQTMETDFWTGTMDKWSDFSVQAFKTGHPSPWMFSLSRFGMAGTAFSYAANFAAFAVPRFLNIMPSLVVIIYSRAK